MILSKEVIDPLEKKIENKDIKVKILKPLVEGGLGIMP